VNDTAPSVIPGCFNRESSFPCTVDSRCNLSRLRHAGTTIQAGFHFLVGFPNDGFAVPSIRSALPTICKPFRTTCMAVPTMCIVVRTTRFVVPTTRSVIRVTRFAFPTIRFVIRTSRLVCRTTRFVRRTTRSVVRTTRLVVRAFRLVRQIDRLPVLAFSAGRTTSKMVLSTSHSKGRIVVRVTSFLLVAVPGVIPVPPGAG